MTQPLTDLVEQFCNYRLKQRGKAEGGVQTYRWILEQFLVFLRNRYGRMARITDLTPLTIQQWMDDMAGSDLALSTMRVRQSAVSSFCGWLVKRDVLATNPSISWIVRPSIVTRRSRFLVRRLWTRSWTPRRHAAGPGTWRYS
jgi:site-specific recombinase XerD